MNEEHKQVFRYYHGEAKSPFGVKEQSANMFWMYEEHFYLEYIENGAKEPFERALVDFLYMLFNEYLPDKWGNSPDWYSKEYFRN